MSPGSVELSGTNDCHDGDDQIHQTVSYNGSCKKHKPMGDVTETMSMFMFTSDGFDIFSIHSTEKPRVIKDVVKSSSLW